MENKLQIKQYIEERFALEDAGLVNARESSIAKGLPKINVNAEEGRFLQLLVRVSGTRNALEIGTLGGYSGIWIARGLIPGGRLITLEKDANHAQVARDNFKFAGVADLVEVRVGDAHQAMQMLIGELPLNFVFIDAEKEGYEDYFMWALDNIEIGGLITAHNTLRGGRVVNEKLRDERAVIMHSFNESVAQEKRVISTIYPGGDGILVAVKIA